MDAVATIVEHLAPQLDRKLKPSAPLFVALQGPQGSGKSYLAALLKAQLSAAPHSLNVAVLSIDDLYLPHTGLVQLAEQHSENLLWRGRGQPGTHDIDLGLRIIRALQSQTEPIELPRFDKSLFDGQGDRLPLGLQDSTFTQPPVDVVIFEGWCVGFQSISQEELDLRWNGVWVQEKERLCLANAPRRADLKSVNEVLKAYVELWSVFDVFVQIKPSPTHSFPSQYSIIYQWRLEQEHNMKASNGGRGMSDEAVKDFVDRYIPGYIFFGDIPASASFGSLSPCLRLRLLLDEARRLVGFEKF